MRYLQIVATMACVLLAVIAFQLHGMKPVRYPAIRKMIDQGNQEQAWKVLENAPVVTVGQIHGPTEVYGSVKIERGDIPIEVEIAR